MNKMNMSFSYRNKNRKQRSSDKYSYFGATSAYLNGDLTIDGDIYCEKKIKGNLSGQAKHLRPNDYPNSGSPNIINSGNGTNDAILTFETGERNYKWRLRARGNGAGAEIYLEYYKGNGEWAIGKFSTDKDHPTAYKDAEGGTP
jgi:hypothetical protein